MKNHLEKVFQGYQITQYDDKLKTIRDPYDQKKVLTDFDGLLLLKSKNENQFPDAKRILVIIEAKHYITKEKVQKKLEQKKQLTHFVNIANNPSELLKTTKKFQQTVQAHKLDKVSDIYLYLGGPFWEPQSKEIVEKEYQQEIKTGHQSTLGIVSITGERYNIKDFASLSKGGKKKC